MSVISCQDLPAHSLNECVDYKQAGISAIAIIFENSSLLTSEISNPGVDILDGDKWVKDFGGEYVDTSLTEDPLFDSSSPGVGGSIVVIKNVNGILSQPSANEVDNPLGQGFPQISVSHSYELTWTDGDISSTGVNSGNDGNNDGFYEKLNDSRAAIAWFYFHENEIRIHPYANVTFTCTIPENPDGTSIQMYSATAKWTAKRNQFPRLYDAPSDIDATYSGGTNDTGNGSSVDITAGWSVFKPNPVS